MTQVAVERIIEPRVTFPSPDESLRDTVRKFTRVVADREDLLMFRPAGKEASELLRLILSSGPQRVPIQRVYVRNVFFEGKKTTFKFYYPLVNVFNKLIFLECDGELLVANFDNVKKFVATQE